jgi:hypothetical protein
MTFFAHGGSARESRRQSGGCAPCFSSVEEGRHRGSLEEGYRLSL